ncbi:DNA primase [Prevotella sp.]|uniref:DNA primase n=1 Tax=Prevotella sp. TaxID=59823 RepID=UPI002ABE4963|nr:DNA primase [Prevotella sp.]
MRISDTDINKILDAANIVEVIGESVNLRKSGSNYFGCCPFHDEKTASMCVSPAKRIFKCFGCGEHGNVIWFVHKNEGISYPEAAMMLAKKYKVDIKVEEKTPEEQAREHEREEVMIVLEAAQKWMQEHIGTEADKYIASRGMNDWARREFRVGASGSYRQMLDDMSKLYKPEIMRKAGLVYLRDNGEQMDYFRHRVTFPFLNRYGRVIGFTARDLTGSAKAKYLNSPDSIVFKKGAEFFGLYQARSEIAKYNKVFLVEGQFDVISMAQNGIRNVICKSGSALDGVQVKRLRLLCENVTLVYDDDKAGIHAAVTQIPVLLDAGMNVRCVMLPEGQDPDDFARANTGQVREKLKPIEMGFVAYLYEKLYRQAADEPGREAGLKTILEAVAHVREATIRNDYMKTLAKLVESSADKLMPKLRQAMSGVKQHEEPSSGFAGICEAKEIYDKEHDKIRLTSSWREFEEGVGERPVVYFRGCPQDSQVQELRQLDNSVVICSPDEDFDYKQECDEMQMLKALFRAGFNIDVVTEVETISFIQWYVNIYGLKIHNETPTTTVMDIYLDRIAEMIAETTEVTRTRSMKAWAQMLSMPSEKALKDIVKPYITRKRSKNKVEAERENLDDVADVDGNTLPDYVEENDEYKRMLSRYGFYPLLSKSKNEPVCYMFKNDSGGYGRVCDFFLTPLLHVYDKDPELNKRIVKITSMAPEIRKAKYVEWKSSVFANMATFRAALVNEGAYNFENGNIKHYDKIWTWMSHQFKTCFQLRTFGQQKEDFFAWSNAIFHRNEKGDFEIRKVDNLGLVEHGGDLFYSPAYSEIYAYDRSDSDIFEQDRHLRYIDVPESRRITFAQWADLMNRVYRIEDNGKWAIIYSILCGFRSDLYPVIGNFTAIFFIGQTSSGKSQIAQSIRALYEVPSAPSSNLNQISDAAFFSILERFRDVPCIFEEYNDEEISDQKFQGLKAVTYDGDGKQKRRSATGNDIETSKVNASIILLGQEAPQRDDNALSNRVVLCEVPAHNFSGDQEAQRIFKELKGYEKEGLSYLLVEVQKLRPLFRTHFVPYMEQARKELQDALAGMSGRSGDQSRIIGTVSMFLATCRLLINDAPWLQLPFGYEDFFELAVKKVRHQCEMLAKSDKLATFFNTLDFLIDKGTLKIGRDFTVDEPDKVTLKGGIVKPIAEGQKVMYMNLSNVHKHYLAAMQGGERPLTLTTLVVNLKSHPAYIGDVSNKKFIWQEEVRTMRTPPNTVNPETMATMAPDDTMIIKIQKKSKQTSAIVLDYNVLQQFMGIDFERATITAQEEDARPF